MSHVHTPMLKRIGAVVMSSAVMLGGMTVVAPMAAAGGLNNKPGVIVFGAGVNRCPVNHPVDNRRGPDPFLSFDPVFVKPGDTVLIGSKTHIAMCTDASSGMYTGYWKPEFSKSSTGQNNIKIEDVSNNLSSKQYVMNWRFGGGQVAILADRNDGLTNTKWNVHGRGISKGMAFPVYYKITVPNDAKPGQYFYNIPYVHMVGTQYFDGAKVTYGSASIEIHVEDPANVPVTSETVANAAADITKDIETLHTANDKMLKDLTTKLNAVNTSVSTNRTEIKKQGDAISVKIDDQNKVLSDLKRSVENGDATITRNLIDQANAIIAQLENNKETINNSIALLNDLIDKDDAKIISELEKNNRQLTKNTASITNMNADMKKAIADQTKALIDRINAVKTSTDNVKASVDSVNIMLGKMNTAQTAALKNQTDLLTKALNTQTATIDATIKDGDKKTLAQLVEIYNRMQKNNDATINAVNAVRQAMVTGQKEALAEAQKQTAQLVTITDVLNTLKDQSNEQISRLDTINLSIESAGDKLSGDLTKQTNEMRDLLGKQTAAINDAQKAIESGDEKALAKADETLQAILNSTVVTEAAFKSLETAVTTGNDQTLDMVKKSIVQMEQVEKAIAQGNKAMQEHWVEEAIALDKQRTDLVNAINKQTEADQKHHDDVMRQWEKNFEAQRERDRVERERWEKDFAARAERDRVERERWEEQVNQWKVEADQRDRELKLQEERYREQLLRDQQVGDADAVFKATLLAKLEALGSATGTPGAPGGDGGNAVVNNDGSNGDAVIAGMEKLIANLKNMKVQLENGDEFSRTLATQLAEMAKNLSGSQNNVTNFITERDTIYKDSDKVIADLVTRIEAMQKYAETLKNSTNPVDQAKYDAIVKIIGEVTKQHDKLAQAKADLEAGKISADEYAKIAAEVSAALADIAKSITSDNSVLTEHMTEIISRIEKVGSDLSSGSVTPEQYGKQVSEIISDIISVVDKISDPAAKEKAQGELGRLTKAKADFEAGTITAEDYAKIVSEVTSSILSIVKDTEKTNVLKNDTFMSMQASALRDTSRQLAKIAERTMALVGAMSKEADAIASMANDLSVKADALHNHAMELINSGNPYLIKQGQEMLKQSADMKRQSEMLLKIAQMLKSGNFKDLDTVRSDLASSISTLDRIMKDVSRNDTQIKQYAKEVEKQIKESETRLETIRKEIVDKKVASEKSQKELLDTLKNIEKNTNEARKGSFFDLRNPQCSTAVQNVAIPALIALPIIAVGAVTPPDAMANIQKSLGIYNDAIAKWLAQNPAVLPGLTALAGIIAAIGGYAYLKDACVVPPQAAEGENTPASNGVK